MSYRQVSRHPFQLLLYFTLSLACVPYVVGQPTRQQERLDEAFLEAVQARDLARMQQLLNTGANINARTRTNGYYALQFAINWPDANLVKWLLEKGTDINLTDDGGDTALMEASDSNRLPIVKVWKPRGRENPFE